MQMVISIPDEWRERIEYNRRPNTIECGELVESIWNGKILPKGYGRLIDGDKLESRMKIGYCIVREAPTIIEADKEVQKQIKQIGYKGCKNCKHQISPLRMCKWAEQGGDGRIHFICPMWDKTESEDKE